MSLLSLPPSLPPSLPVVAVDAELELVGCRGVDSY